MFYNYRQNNIFDDIMRDEIVSERVKEVKEKILSWLKEEAMSPEELADPNAYFNIKVKVRGLVFHIVQNVRNIDSLFVGGKLVLTPAQLSLLRNNMDEKKRQEFFWDLRLALLRNNELGDFQIKPNPPHDVREVLITSRRIFYDSLTKDRLISAILAVYKAIIMVIWMLERYAGAITPKEGKALFYV